MNKKRRKKKKCLAKIPELEFRRCKNERNGAKYCQLHKNWKKKIGKKFQCIEIIGRKRCLKTVEAGSKYCGPHNTSRQNHRWTSNNVLKKGH